jgi:hypothetical protein
MINEKAFLQFSSFTFQLIMSHLRLGWLILLAFAFGGLVSCNTRRASESQAGTVDSLSNAAFTSNLPIVVVDTFGQWIPDDPKIPAKLKIIHDPSGGRNSLDSSHVDFEGKIGVEIRGQSSKQYPKKQYSFELLSDDGKDVEASLLGLPADSDWILHAPYSDKTLMRNFLAYHFSNRIGRYAARTEFVELFLNQTGARKIERRHYMGVYLLMERIKRGEHRVNIQPLKPGHDGPPEITGGYILKIDKVDWTDRYFLTDWGIRFIYVYPKAEQITEAQERWIQNYVNAFENALSDADFDDPENGYARYIDIDSFIDYFIINELFKNIDAYRISAFVHKDRDGKLRMGPVWDFNISMGNADYYGGWRTDGWIVDAISEYEGYPIPFWWKRLLQDRRWVRRLIERWKALRKSELAASELIAVVNQTAEYLSEAQTRNFQKWRVLGQYVWPNPEPYPRTYHEEVERLEKWLTNRLTWMDRHIEGLTPE